MSQNDGSDDLDQLINSALNDLREKPKPTTNRSAGVDAAEGELSSLRKALSTMRTSLDAAAAAASATLPADAKPEAAGSTEKATDATEPGDDLNQGKTAFDDAIRSIAESAEQAASETPSDPNAFMEQLMRGFQGAMGGAGESAGAGEGEGGEAAAAAMMEQLMMAMGMGGNGENMEEVMKSMVEAMTSKEAIYDSLCDLVSKYPAWIEAKKKEDGFSAEEIERREKQLEVMLRLKAEYEKPDEEHDREKITDLINEMHSYGPPPPELAPEDIRAQLEQMSGGAGGVPDFGMMPNFGAAGDEDVDPNAMAKQLEEGCKQG